MNIPEDRRVIISFDVAFEEARLLLAFGVVARIIRGRVLSTAIKIHKWAASSFAARALACNQAMETGFKLGIDLVVIEGDSSTVIKKADRKRQTSY